MATGLSNHSRRLSDESAGLYEVVDGCVVERAEMGAYESWLAKVLYDLLHAHVVAGAVGQVLPETLFDLAPAVTRQRRPDLAFLSADRWPIGRPAPRVTAWKIVPELAIELVSPTNLGGGIVSKVRDYFAAGVRRVWVIYPLDEQVYDYASPTQVTILTQADRLDGGDVLPGFSIDLGAFFGEPENAP